MNLGISFWSHFRSRTKHPQKHRPAVVVSSGAYNASKPDIVIVGITSQLRPVGALGAADQSALRAAIAAVLG